MSSLKLKTSANGAVFLTAENTANEYTASLPALSGTLAVIQPASTVNAIAYLDTNRRLVSSSALTFANNQLTLSAGTAAAPSLTTTGDTNTGLYFPAADTVGVAVGGVNVGNFTSAGFTGNAATATTAAACTGNAATATTFSTNRTNYKGVTDGAVSGQLMWKNYGNSHTIFDASNGTSPSGTSISQSTAQFAWSASYPTLMGWNGSETYGVRVDSARVSDSCSGNAARLTSVDNRIVAPSEANSYALTFGFAAWNNATDSSPYADYLHMRSYSDSSGGNDNLIMFNKSQIGMRIWQQSFGSSAAYSTYKDVAWTDGTNSVATDWVHSGRDFVNGTLITTSIDYSVTYGDPFVLEIRGNSYYDLTPIDIQYQGYIYNNTIINHGGVSNGYTIWGMCALNVSGALCFWFPRQSYWQGFNVKVYRALTGKPLNTVTSITDVAKPAGTKEVSLTNFKSSGSGVAGQIAYFAMSSPPSGWVACNGSTLSRTIYATLFSAIGTTYGAGNGSTTFNLPDLRGEFIRGWDAGRGADSGRVLGSWQADAFRSHTHNILAYDLENGSGRLTHGGQPDAGVYQTEATGGSETRPRNVAMLACIKF